MIFGNKKENKIIEFIAKNEKDLNKKIMPLKEEHLKLYNILKQINKDTENIKDFIKAMSEIVSSVQTENSKVFEAEERIEKLSSELAAEKEKYKKLSGEKGGLTKSNNELKKENEELKKKLDEALSGAYLKRELKPDKTKSKQQMKIKNHVTSSQAKTILKSKNSETV